MFDHQYISYESAKRDVYKNFLVKMPLKKVMDMICEYSNKMGFEELKRDEEFHEIYSEKYPFAFSFICVPCENNDVQVSILVYTNRWGGGAKRMVRSINADLKNLFHIA